MTSGYTLSLHEYQRAVERLTEKWRRTFKEINTAAPGLRIGEHLPKLAEHGRQLAVVRSMASKEGDHDRATFFLRTGYTPVGAIKFPAVGAVLANELGSTGTDLPNFVSIAPSRYAANIGGGLLGPKVDPLGIGRAGARPTT